MGKLTSGVQSFSRTSGFVSGHSGAAVTGVTLGIEDIRGQHRLVMRMVLERSCSTGMRHNSHCSGPVQRLLTSKTMIDSMVTVAAT